MSSAPVEFIEIVFPGNKLSGDVVPALRSLVDSGTIHILDLLFVKKDADGNVQSFELSALDADEGAAFEALEGDIDGLLTMDDMLLAAREMPHNCSAALLVWENLWAARFAEAVRAAHGQVVIHAPIPRAAIEAAEAARDA